MELMGNKRDYTKGLKILDSLIEGENLAALKFKKGNQKVTFDEVHSIGKHPKEIAKGVFVHVEEDLNKNEFIIICSMDEGATLDTHEHPGYDEIFDLMSGIIFDIVSETIINNTNRQEFKANTPHKIIAITKAFMKIKCVKVQL